MVVFVNTECNSAASISGQWPKNPLRLDETKTIFDEIIFLTDKSACGCYLIISQDNFEREEKNIIPTLLYRQLKTKVQN